MKKLQLVINASHRALKDGHVLLEAECDIALTYLCLEIAEALKNGESVTLPKVGRFLPKKIKATRCVNPRTGEILALPERSGVKFKESTGLRNALRHRED